MEGQCTRKLTPVCVATGVTAGEGDASDPDPVSPGMRPEVECDDVMESEVTSGWRRDWRLAAAAAPPLLLEGGGGGVRGG